MRGYPRDPHPRPPQALMKASALPYPPLEGRAIACENERCGSSYPSPLRGGWLAQILYLGQSGGGATTEAVPVDPHPGLRFRTMLRIAFAQPTLRARGEGSLGLSFKIANAAKARVNMR